MPLSCLIIARMGVWRRGLAVRIKICGITRPGDAEQALALGADTVGCVFHAESARHVTAEIAQDIQIAVGNAGTVVGLFVDPTVEQVQAVLDRIDLDVLQFHCSAPLGVAASGTNHRV